MQYLFLKEDYDALVAQRDALKAKMTIAHEETAESTLQTSETWHDNFVFEEGQRQLKMLMQTIGELSLMIDLSEVIEKDTDTHTVHIGSVVTFQDLDTGMQQSVQIGSYRVFFGENVISYASPLGQILLGAHVGERRDGKIGPISKSFLVKNIE